jgi:hypothetical protein
MIVVFLGPRLPDIIFARPTVEFPTAASCAGQHLDIPAGTIMWRGLCVLRHRAG